MSDVPKPLEDIARHYFGDLQNIVLFPEVALPHVGRIDFVLVRHKTMKPEVDDFTPVEFQTDSTTSTGHLVNGFRDFQEGQDLTNKNYLFGMNTYDTIKRAITQLMNKGIVYESWNAKAYWVMQEYIYANLVRRYGLRKDGFSPKDSSYFALYDIVTKQDRLTLQSTRYISTTVDEVYQAMRNKPTMPSKDSFVQGLNNKLRLKLNVGSD